MFQSKYLNHNMLFLIRNSQKLSSSKGLAPWF